MSKSRSAHSVGAIKGSRASMKQPGMGGVPARARPSVLLAGALVMALAAGLSSWGLFRLLIRDGSSATPRVPRQRANVDAASQSVVPDASGPGVSARSVLVAPAPAVAPVLTNEPTEAETRAARMAQLVNGARREPRDAAWARASESAIRETLGPQGGAAGVHLSTVQCASRRCVVEAETSIADIDNFVLKASQVPGLPKGSLVHSRSPDGKIAATLVLARSGFATDGSELPPKPPGQATAP